MWFVFDGLLLAGSAAILVALNMTWLGGDFTGQFLIDRGLGFTPYFIPHQLPPSAIVTGVVALVAVIISFVEQRKFKHLLYIVLLLSTLYGFSFFVMAFFGEMRSPDVFAGIQKMAMNGDRLGAGTWLAGIASLTQVVAAALGLVLLIRRARREEAAVASFTGVPAAS